MPRRGASQQVTVMEDTSMSRVTAKFVSSILVLVPPWVLWIVGMILTAIFHAVWRGSLWASLGMLPPVVALTLLAYLLTHSRGWLGRLHVTATPAAAGMWWAFASMFGPLGNPAIAYVTLIGGMTMCLTWNFRMVIRTHEEHHGGGDPLTALWDKVRNTSTFSGTKARITDADDNKINAQIAIDGGGDKTVEDLQKRTLNAETAAGLPPGSLVISANTDRADLAEMSITDPRILKRTLPYPGPRDPGGSVADPLGLGLYQDMEDVLIVLAGVHLMINGMSGSGKSIGGAWNLLAALMARQDAVIIAADLTKADQTLGDAANAIDWLVLTRADAEALMSGLQRAIPARTAWLSAHGFKKWERGCGIKHVYVLLEECPDIITAIDEEEFTKLAKAARSAGITLILSLQRSSYTEIPTVVRGQFGAMMCFGVNSSDDAAFGLPEKVLDAGASPEDWGVDHPGMAYLSAPGIPMSKRIMPLRTYMITAQEMQELAGRFPASARPLDEVTARAFGDVYAKRPSAQEAIQRVRAAAGVDVLDRIDPAVSDAQDAPSDGVPAMPAFERPLCMAAQLVVSSQYATTQMLARKMRVDELYAGRLMDLLEDRGVVGPERDAEPREVLVIPDGLPQALAMLAQADVDDAPVLPPDGEEDDMDPVDLDDDAQVAPPAPEDDVPWQTAPPRPQMAPQDARAVFIEQLREWKAAGRAEITAPDLAAVRERVGMSRPWANKMLDVAVKDGILRRDPVRPVYAFTDAPIDAPAVASS